MSLVRIFTFATLFLLILSPVRSARAQGDITGNWLADAGGIYYFRQIGDEVFGAGVSTQSDPLGATEFQAGLQFTSLLHGHVRPATDDDAFLPFGRPLSVMTAAWVDVPRGTILGRGTIVFAVFPSFLLRTASSTTVPNGLEGALWTRLPTRVWPVNTPSGFEAFGRTQRNDGGTMADHLNLYRDDTVLYGEVGRFPGAIHVNFPGIGSGILPTYYNMIGADCNGPKDNPQRIGWWPEIIDDPPDGDLNVIVDPFLTKLLTQEGWSTGWSGLACLTLNFAPYCRACMPDGCPDFALGPAQTQMIMEDKLRRLTTPPTSPVHGEILMYGRDAESDCDAGSNFGTPVLPGWAEDGANSVLLNGRPMNGAGTSCLRLAPDVVHCSQNVAIGFQGVCDGSGGTANITSIFDEDNTAACPVYSALGYSIDACTETGICSPAQELTDPPKILRLTGALITDCHGGRQCGDLFPSSLNVEIHPVYAVDIISPTPRSNLTGTWGASDGGTYYIRELIAPDGSVELWWLGLSRDRGRTYATVFQGTREESAISGHWADIPLGDRQNSSPSTTGQPLRLGVNQDQSDDPDESRIKHDSWTLIQGSDLAAVGPRYLEKLYDPPDHTPPTSTLTIGQPQVSGTVPFVTTATTLDLHAEDVGTGAIFEDVTGLQFIGYRFTPMSRLNVPAYTSILGDSARFVLSGPDGRYSVQTQSVDNVGNSEVHEQVVYLDDSAPVARIVQPAGGEYEHSATVTLTYAVDDGSGSGVGRFMPLLDGAPSLAGHGLQSGQTIDLLTELPLGYHQFSVVAVDNLGNSGTLVVSFNIIVTPQSIKDEVTHFLRSGMIKNGGIGNSLLAKLDAASSARDEGNCERAEKSYGAFINELQAQLGRGVDASAAGTMVADARYLVATCL